jgi:hypothetical protein
MLDGPRVTVLRGGYGGLLVLMYSLARAPASALPLTIFVPQLSGIRTKLQPNDEISNGVICDVVVEMTSTPVRARRMLQTFSNTLAAST